MQRRLRSWLTILGAAGLAALVTLTLIPSGPQIDPQRVVKANDYALFRMTILTYRRADFRGWPVARRERAYLRHLQDRGVRLAFVEAGDGLHHALVGPIDSLRIKWLYDSAREAGLSVPSHPAGSRFED